MKWLKHNILQIIHIQYILFAVISLIFTHTEIVEQQSTAPLRCNTGCAVPPFSLTWYSGFVKAKVIPTGWWNNTIFVKWKDLRHSV